MQLIEDLPQAVEVVTILLFQLLRPAPESIFHTNQLNIAHNSYAITTLDAESPNALNTA